MEPTDWEVIRLARDTTATGLLGGYLRAVPPEHATYVGPPPMQPILGPYLSPIDAVRAVMVQLEDDDGDL